MRFECYPDPDALGRAAAARIATAVQSGAWRIGVATGATPRPTYAELRRLHRAGALECSHCHLVLLDEYAGLAPDHPESYTSTITNELARPLGIPPSHVHTPRLDDEGPTARAFGREIERLGGVDLQLLGIGRNGHIGFNEPGSPASSRTRLVELSPTTRLDNARFFDDPDHVPTHAVTRGLADIAAARSILLLATGTAKAEVVQRLYEADPSLPASILTTHDDTTVMLDDEAARLVARRGGCDA